MCWKNLLAFLENFECLYVTIIIITDEVIPKVCYKKSTRCPLRKTNPNYWFQQVWLRWLVRHTFGLSSHNDPYHSCVDNVVKVAWPRSDNLGLHIKSTWWKIGQWLKFWHNVFTVESFMNFHSIFLIFGNSNKLAASQPQILSQNLRLSTPLW